jgi:hypothetical protein
VFSGTVARLSPTPTKENRGERIISYSKLSVSFNVETVFRGEAEKQIDVITGMSDGAFGYRFQIGERYLVSVILNQQRGLSVVIDQLQGPCSPVGIEIISQRIRVFKPRDATRRGLVHHRGQG